MIHARRALLWFRCRKKGVKPMYAIFATVGVLFSITALVLMFMPDQSLQKLQNIPVFPRAGKLHYPQQRPSDFSVKGVGFMSTSRQRDTESHTKTVIEKILNVFPNSLVDSSPQRAKIPQTVDVRDMPKESYEIDQSKEVVPLELSPNRQRPYHLIWNTSLTHIDRIVKQLQFVPRHQRLTRPVNILILNKNGGEKLRDGTDQFVSDHCRVRNCKLLTSHTEHADAIITSQLMVFDKDIWQDRREEDVWIYYNLESPQVILTDSYYVPMVDKTFNWTATYRHDSTLVAPYEKWVAFGNASRGRSFHISGSDDTTEIVPKNYAAGKTKMAAAIMSNCDAASRNEVIRQLQTSNISVDVYGACGTPCDDCLKMVEQDYKFYLAFENSNCVDYITEKFFRNGLKYDVVPIAFGASPSDYKRSAPPLSYIHVEDFPSIPHLAAYMKAVDQDDALYNSYFQWKGTGTFINTKFWCRLCAMLNDPDKPKLVISDLSRWWTVGACTDPVGVNNEDNEDANEEIPGGAV